MAAASAARGLQLPRNNYGVPKIGRDEMDAVLGSDGLSREAAELARQGARAERAAIVGRLVLECLSLEWAPPRAARPSARCRHV